MKRPLLYILPLMLLILVACEPSESQVAEDYFEPNPIAYGEAEDPYCNETITEKRYGAVLVTKDGTRHTFSSVECMIGYELAGHVSEEDIEQRWVVDTVRNKYLLPAAEAHYLHSKNQPSPGGLDLTPFNGSEHLSYNMRFLLHGDDLTWGEAVEVVRSEWFAQAETAR